MAILFGKWTCNIESHPGSFHVSTRLKASYDPKVLCGLTCSSSSHAPTVSHTYMQYLMHAPHTSSRLCFFLSSPLFIRLLLWCGIPWSPRNTVLGNKTEWICAFAIGRSFPLFPFHLLHFLSLFSLLSITLSILSSTFQHLLLQDEGHYPIRCTYFKHSSTSSATITSYPNPEMLSAHFIKEPFGILLPPLVKCSAGSISCWAVSC